MGKENRYELKDAPLYEVLQQHFEPILHAMRADGKSKNTVRAYSRYLEKLISFSRENPELHNSDISRNVILQFFDYAKLTPSQRAQAKYAILWTIDYLQDAGFDAPSASQIARRLKRIRQPDPEPQITLPPEVIWHAVHLASTKRGITAKRDAAIIALMADAWLRIGEVCSVTAADLLPHERTLLIRGKGSAEQNGMRRVSASCRLSPNVWNLVAEYIDWWRKPTSSEKRVLRTSMLPMKPPAPAVFTTHQGCPVNIDSLRRSIVRRLRDAAEDLGLHDIPWQRIGAHTIRRSMATHAYLSRKMTLREVQAKLRHKQITTTAKYLILNGDPV